MSCPNTSAVSTEQIGPGGIGRELACSEGEIMRTLVTIASVVALAATSVACEQGSNSANNLITAPSVVSETMLQAKGGNGNGKGNISPLPPTSMTVVVVNEVGAVGVNYGDTVKFDIAPATSGAFITLSCNQGSNSVYAAGGWPSGSAFTLSSGTWAGGEADCTARLYTSTDGIKETTLTTHSFHVAE
jgi:hypothetical protein